MNLWYRLKRLLETLYEAPHLLHGQGQQHERSFERLLLRYGILPYSSFCTRSIRSAYSNRFSPTGPIGYERHPNGPQRWPDFHLCSRQILLPVELKSTRRSVLQIGQTWIQSDALYIASYRRPTLTRRDEPSVFISWGKDMKTEEEDRRFRDFQYTIKSIRGQRGFSSPVEWHSAVQISYRLDEERRRVCFERVREDLERWARGAR